MEDAFNKSNAFSTTFNRNAFHPVVKVIQACSNPLTRCSMKYIRNSDVLDMKY